MELKTGTCFICNEPCEEKHYSHLECAYKESERINKERRERKLIEKDIKKIKGLEKKEK